MQFAGFLGIKFDKGKRGDPSNIMCRMLGDHAVICGEPK
jgi:hypothetical protein